MMLVYVASWIVLTGFAAFGLAALYSAAKRLDERGE